LDISPLYIAAHVAWETGWGISRIFRDKNHAFGYGTFDRCPYDCALSFDSVQDSGVFAMGKVNAKYLTPGGKFYNGSKLAGMNVRYATDQNWKYGIAGIMNSLLDVVVAHS
jgi:beta-N-acetylglucosaminidase